MHTKASPLYEAHVSEALSVRRGEPAQIGTIAAEVVAAAGETVAAQRDHWRAEAQAAWQRVAELEHELSQYRDAAARP